jgi:ADP-heptose:LPS heptosyltransferase
MSLERVLVIKLSALGDFVQALGPAAAIRQAHPRAKITLLTTAPYAALAEMSPYFDDVWIDERPKAWKINKVMALALKLRSGRFQRVYDLQTNDRSGFYFKLMGKPEWSGIAPGCAFPHNNLQRDFMHTIDRQAEQLAAAGIAWTPFPDLSWVDADIRRFGLRQPYAILAPGGAAHRPDKRWPDAMYGELARKIAERGVQPVVIGTMAESMAIDVITTMCPQAVSLKARTSIADIAVLARHSIVAIGNDTGPMHMIAIAGCPSVVLYSHASDPELCGQRGRVVSILREPTLQQLSLERVMDAIRAVSEMATLFVAE